MGITVVAGTNVGSMVKLVVLVGESVGAVVKPLVVGANVGVLSTYV